MPDKETIIFTAPNNAVYEGICFENGYYRTSDPTKIARLRKSFFYGKDIQEIAIDPKTGEPIIKTDGENENPYTDKTKAQLRDLLDERNVSYETDANKARLMELAIESEKA